MNKNIKAKENASSLALSVLTRSSLDIARLFTLLSLPFRTL